MCHHDKSWADKKAVQIADLMKMEIDYPDSSSDNPQTLISTTPQGIVGYRADLSRPDDGKRISLYSIIFSSPSDKAKKSLCSDVSKPTLVCSEDDLSYSKDRAKINLELKDNLLNDCLADASYYLGNL
jgi:hypothetical protein